MNRTNLSPQPVGPAQAANASTAIEAGACAAESCARAHEAMAVLLGAGLHGACAKRSVYCACIPRQAGRRRWTGQRCRPRLLLDTVAPSACGQARGATVVLGLHEARIQQAGQRGRSPHRARRTRRCAVLAMGELGLEVQALSLTQDRDARRRIRTREAPRMISRPGARVIVAVERPQTVLGGLFLVVQVGIGEAQHG